METWWTQKCPFSAFRSADAEPSLGELLADPVASAVMRADGVVAEDVFAIFERLHARMSRAARDNRESAMQASK